MTHSAPSGDPPLDTFFRRQRQLADDLLANLGDGIVDPEDLMHRSSEELMMLIHGEDIFDDRLRAAAGTAHLRQQYEKQPLIVRAIYDGYISDLQGHSGERREAVLHWLRWGTEEE